MGSWCWRSLSFLARFFHLFVLIRGIFSSNYARIYPAKLFLEIVIKYKYTIAAVSIFFCSNASFAASPVSNVGTAKVDAGALSIEQRIGYTIDTPGESGHKRFRMRQHLDYGWNDWYATRIVLEQNKMHSDNLEHASLSIENRFQIFEKASDGWDGGFRFIYGQRDGDKTPHEIDIRLMAGVPIDDEWEWRHNTVLEHDIGENSQSGWQLEFRNQITKKLDLFNEYDLASFRLGVEMFNDFGRLNDLSGYAQQDHQIGPVVKIGFENGAYLQTSYRIGASRDSADHSFKLFVGRYF